MAVANGAAGVSVLQPMFLKPTYDELFQHFKAIAESVPGTPMLLYNNPGGWGTPSPPISWTPWPIRWKTLWA